MAFSGENLTCVRGERLVFSGLSFVLPAGRTLYVRGPNGSGKSSLLRLAAGLLRPAAGRLAFEGRDIAADRDAHAARVLYVGHLDPLKSVMTVEENLAFWIRLTDPDLVDLGDAIDHALSLFGLAALADSPARFLSSGQRRRVNLARLALARTSIWLLDEPTTGLDQEAVSVLRVLLDRHAAAGGMSMVATHADLPLERADTLRLGQTAGDRAEAAA